MKLKGHIFMFRCGHYYEFRLTFYVCQCWYWCLCETVYVCNISFPQFIHLAWAKSWWNATQTTKTFNNSNKLLKQQHEKCEHASLLAFYDYYLKVWSVEIASPQKKKTMHCIVKFLNGEKEYQCIQWLPSEKVLLKCCWTLLFRIDF